MLNTVQTSDLIDTAEVAALFSVDSSTVRRWVQAGKLAPVVTRSSGHLFDRAAVLAIAEGAA